MYIEYILYMLDIYSNPGERMGLMEIYISNQSQKPIYEQITGQLKEKILTGELAEGEALPSIRLLAKELHISVITTKRAYEDLERDGFVATVPGKGSFVAAQNPAFRREEALRRVEEHLANAVNAARLGGVSRAEVSAALDLLYETAE